MTARFADDASGRLVEKILAYAAMVAAGPAPRFLVQAALDRLLGAIERHHPEARARLQELPPAEVLVDPVDLPRAFALRVGPVLRLRLVSRHAPADAAIRGRFEALLDLLEGRIDGDALFFSRELIIEGNTELVLAVRNTLDGAGIDLIRDVEALAGPLHPLVGPGRRAIGRLADLVVGIHRQLLAPADQRLQRVEERLERLESGRP